MQSPRSKKLQPRVDEADHIVRSICPYCAVGCAQLVYVKDGEVTQIEGDPASGLALHWSVFRAGFQSARDPRYTVIPQKQRKAP